MLSVSEIYVHPTLVVKYPYTNRYFTSIIPGHKHTQAHTHTNFRKATYKLLKLKIIF